VGQYHRLRNARGAAGVEQARHRLTSTASVVDVRTVGYQVLVAHHSRRSHALPGVDHGVQMWIVFADLPNCGAERVVDDQHARLRIIQ
jgi:hypothetical protein